MDNIATVNIFEENERLRARIAELERQLQESPHALTHFRLPPSLLATLSLLLREPVIDIDKFEADGNTPKNIKAAIHRLRKMLAPHKINIKSRRSTGYWIDDADKERIREMITGVVTPVSDAA